jgi:apolipoprotein N-acyltransferase
MAGVLRRLGGVGLAGVVGQQVMGPVDAAPRVRSIRIVQPNVPQAEKWRRESRAASCRS